MNSFSTTLAENILAKDFDNCSLQELSALAQKYPYASAIQLLYTQKLYKTGDEKYADQLQKTLLQYNNPLFIRHLIETDKQQQFTDATLEEPIEATNHPLPKSKNIESTEGQKTIAAANEIVSTPSPTESIDEEEIIGDDDDDTPLPPLPEFKIEKIDPAKAEFAFTPYFTVDYFAAQGIKLGDAQSAEDRFDTQLKSFTAWLKQMKRLPGASSKGSISVGEEKSIEQMAEASLREQNAETEAMAQVWAKQGNKKKAIEIYQKLKLQIPAKSAYFAAKIEFLKK